MEDLDRVLERLAEIDDPVTLLASLFAHAPVGFQVYRADGQSLLVNRAFRDIFASEPPPEYNILRDEIAAAHGVLPLIQRAFAGEVVKTPPIWYNPRDLQQVHVTDGRRAAIETTFVPLFNRTGAVSHVVVVFRDLTAELLASEQQTKSEEALQDREASFHALFASNPLPMWVYDLETLQILEVNQAAVLHYGYSRDEFLQLTIADMRPPEDVPRLRANLAQGRESWQHSGIWRHRRKSGAIIDVDITSHTLTFQGRSAALVVAQDITERRRLEEQLRQAQKMEAVGRLAGGVAHDFNNLLTAILGYSKFALEELEATHPAHNDVKEIQKAGESAASLTKQLLAFSRRQVLQPQILDLNTVVERVDSLLRRLIGEDIELVARLGASLDLVNADPGQIEQIIMNLAVNARDAMPKGGKLTIETANATLDESFLGEHRGAVVGPHVMLAISDTGTGMDEATQSHLFEPFFTTKKRGEGTGLGLATVYGIVKQSGGSIWVYSELGLGTTFKVYLPRATEEVARPEVTVTPKALDGNETILLAEDQAEVRAVSRAVLARRGYTVLEASSGPEALKIVREYSAPIHLLLTDVVMPSMSGRELAARLHTMRPAIRVLYASGYTDDAIVRHGVLEPGLAFIQKPFTPEGLLRKVREVLDSR